VRSTNVRETALFDVDRARVSTSLADRLLSAPIAAGRDAGEHPLQHDPGQRIAIGEMLVRLQRHLRRPVRGPHPRPADLDAAPAQRDLTIVMTMTDSGPLPVPLALRADDFVDLFLKHLAQHTEPDAHAQRQQPLLRGAYQLPQRLLHAHGKHGLIAGRLPDRYGLLHGGSSFRSWQIHPSRSHQERTGRRDRRHLKLLHAPGQPPAA
jgi:hypothetical protein